MKIIFFIFIKKFLIFSFLVFLLIIAISSSIIKSYFLKHIEVFHHFYNILSSFLVSILHNVSIFFISPDKYLISNLTLSDGFNSFFNINYTN